MLICLQIHFPRNSSWLWCIETFWQKIKNFMIVVTATQKIQDSSVAGYEFYPLLLLELQMPQEQTFQICENKIYLYLRKGAYTY
jgi:hypothetical protein